MKQKLERTTFRTSRLLDFCSRKELVAQTGHEVSAWPLVILKELMDNAIDACEDAEINPQVEIRVDDEGITVADNGAGEALSLSPTATEPVPGDADEHTRDLHFCRQRLEKYGGSFTINTDRGHGTRIIMTLPEHISSGE